MSFATNYSRSFERLSRALLAQQLGIPEDQIVLTQAVKDGGLDGYRDFGLGTILGQDLRFSLAFEAKLRAAGANPGLDIFAKAMIIAFNGRRHGLAVTTNRLFTPQCANEAAQFQLRTGLQFIFVDGPRVSLWIRPRLPRLLSESYEPAFLEGLLWEDDEARVQAPAPAALEVPCEGGLRLPVHVTVRAQGAASRERLLGRVEARPVAPSAADLPGMIGEARRSVLEGLGNAVAAAAGLHVLWGEAGVGKSLVMAHLMHDFAGRGWSVSCINLRACFAARDLFLKLLAALLGVNLSAALAEVGAGRAAELLATLLGSVGDPPPGLETAAAALCADRIAAPADLDHSLLLSLLERAVEQRSTGPGAAPEALIVLQEATYATPEVCDFLSRAATSLGVGKVRLLVESRLHDLDDVSSRNWEAFRLALRTAAASEFTLLPFSRRDARDYLNRLLPGIGGERADFIVGRVGTAPLFLETARDYLLERGAVVVHAGRHSIVEDLDTFFEGINPEKPVALIRLQVEYWGRRFEGPFHTAAILDGHFPAAAVASAGAGAGEREDLLLDGLIRTGLFEASWRSQGVQARHGLIIDALKTFAADNPFAASRVARALLPIVDRLEADPLSRRAREADLNATARRRTEAIALSHEVGKTFWRQQQLELAARYLSQAHNLARELEEHVGGAPDRPPAELWNLLLDLLELQDQRHRLPSEEATYRLSDVAALWSQGAVRDGIVEADLRVLRLRAGYVLWRSEHMRERFAAAETIARGLFEAVAECKRPCAIPSDVAGRCLAAVGTTLKAIGRVDESRASFQRALALFPDSLELVLNHHSNEAALLLADQPERALDHYDSMIALRSAEAAFHVESLHTWVDRAMALFLMRRYDDALEEGYRAERLASANGVAAQAARARNILGCCRWAQGDAEEASQFFERAILDAERSLSERFLWRMRTNMAGAALETGRRDEAAANARSAAERIIQARDLQWPDPADVLTRRWYHALIQCAAILDRLGDDGAVTAIVAKVPVEGYAEEVSRFGRGEGPAPHWLNATSIHAGRIMITG